MDKYQAIIDYIKDIESTEKTLEYENDDGDEVFVLVVNEQADFDDVYTAINTIVDAVVDQEFAYELIDLMIPYYLLQLFTDVEPPIITDEKTGDEYPDYAQCYKIATYLNLEYELTQVSPIVAGYIYALTQNIWRRLDYHKSEGAFIKQRLNDALLHFYEIVDEIDEVLADEAEMDVDGFMRQVNKIAEQLDTLKNITDVSSDDTKSSVDLAVVDSE